MEMMTSQRLFYQSDEHIRVWHLNNFHKLFIQLGFEIVTSRLVKSSSRPTRLMLQGQDGAIRIVSPTDGTVITTMFPLENVPDTIVDYAYCPMSERLYTVLSTGGILVFSSSTNPCRSVNRTGIPCFHCFLSSLFLLSCLKSLAFLLHCLCAT